MSFENAVALPLITRLGFVEVQAALPEVARVLATGNRLVVLVPGATLTQGGVQPHLDAWREWLATLAEAPQMGVALLFLFPEGCPATTRTEFAESQTSGAVAVKVQAGWVDGREPAAWIRPTHGDEKVIVQTIEEALRRGPRAVDDAAYQAAIAQVVTQDRAFVEKIAAVTPWATYLIMACCAVVFVLATAAGGTTSPLVLIRFGAGESLLVREGEWWRLWGATFLHIGILHILVNMYSLYAVGPTLERLLGNDPYLAMYATAGLCGSLASTWHHTGTNAVSAGASGALFGVFGAVAYVGFRYKQEIPEPVRRRLTSNMVGLIFFNLLLGATAGFDNAAHVGGLIGGLLFTALITTPPVERFSRQLGGVYLTLGILPFVNEAYVLWIAYDDPARFLPGR
ncbi:MAG: rhomboid family intramembrane serine protease [Armatimonadetes bacterium]|nr:rhomboid family intramembrane serine protease [Armatimonadota bacterium]